jgi:hypothetical protein
VLLIVDAASIGKAVVKMSVTSSENRCPQGQQQHRPFPANPITVRGEDVCYFDC